jgi:uncharacterized damage-inducible protein DinB
MAALSRTESLERHRAEMARLLRAAARVAPDRRDEPVYRVWSPKDVLAHIAAWDRLLLGAIAELVAGERPRFGRTSVFNKRAVDASRGRSYGQVLDELRSAHEALMRRIEALRDDQWSSGRGRWGDKTPMTVGSLLDYTYQGETHYGGHAAELEAWLERG